MGPMPVHYIFAKATDTAVGLWFPLLTYFSENGAIIRMLTYNQITVILILREVNEKNANVR